MFNLCRSSHQPPKKGETKARSNIPLSVVIAVIALGTIPALQLVGVIIAVVVENTLLPTVFVHISVEILILAGIISGHRLAWKLTRILVCIIGSMSIFYTAIFSMAVIFFPTVKMNATMLRIVVWLLFVAIVMFVVYYALGRPTARKYFGIVCPKSDVDGTDDLSGDIAGQQEA